jgi:hypothetical protein
MIDDPFHCWEDGNSNRNSNSHQADGVTGRNANDTISNPSPSSTSSFWSISKQDPPPSLSHNINAKPQRNQETPQVVAVTTPETTHSSSTNTSGSYSSYNTKDTRKDRIAQLVIQHNPFNIVKKYKDRR